MVLRQFAIACAILAGTANAVPAQSEGAGKAGRRALLPRAREIALARSAAPPEVTGEATILALTDGGYVVAHEGTNGVTCYVDRSWPESLEPHCYDAEGSATVLPIRTREAQLRQQGKSREEIDRDIADGLRSGRFRTPRRPAMSYMMSSAQVLFNDQGKRVGSWQPHLMIYVPHITSADLGLGGTPSTKAALVVDSGKPLANILVLVKEFVDPDPEAYATP